MQMRRLRTGLLPASQHKFKNLNSLLLLPESKETNTGDLDDLETDTGDISLGLSATTETGDENLVVLIGEVETTVVGDESGDLLAVLDELDTDTLANSRVGLLGLDTDLGLVGVLDDSGGWALWAFKQFSPSSISKHFQLLLHSSLLPMLVLQCPVPTHITTTHLLEDDALGVGGTTGRRGLVELAEGALVVVLVGPTVLATRGAQLTGGLDTTGLVR